MHIRAQGIGGKAFLPQSWGELRYVGSWMLAHALEHIDQVVIGIDPMQPAGDDQTLDNAHVFRAQFVQQNSHALRPIGIARNARSRWLVSIGTSGSVRNTSSPNLRSRA